MDGEVKIEKYYQIGDLLDFAESVETKEGNLYYHLPYWFQADGGGLIMHNKIPEDLGMFITKEQLGGGNPRRKPPKL